MSGCPLQFRANQLRNMVGQNQFGIGGARFAETLTALPLADMRAATSRRISRAFSVFRVSSRIRHGIPTECEQQLAVRLLDKDSLHLLFRPLVDDATEMNFVDDWTKSLENVGGHQINSGILRESTNRTVDLISATREASQELSGLTYPPPLSTEGIHERANQVPRAIRCPPHTNWWNHLIHRYLDRRFKPKPLICLDQSMWITLGESLRAYQQQIDANTGDLMNVPAIAGRRGAHTREPPKTGGHQRKPCQHSTSPVATWKHHGTTSCPRPNRYLLDPLGTITADSGFGCLLGIRVLRHSRRNKGRRLLAATRTFENIPIEELGGLTGKQLRERILSVEGEKLGLSTRAEDDELTRLKADEIRIMADSLEAQRQLTMYAAQTAMNTEMMARSFGASVAPMKAPTIAATATARILWRTTTEYFGPARLKQWQG